MFASGPTRTSFNPRYGYSEGRAVRVARPCHSGILGAGRARVALNATRYSDFPGQSSLIGYLGLHGDAAFR